MHEGRAGLPRRRRGSLSYDYPIRKQLKIGWIPSNLSNIKEEGFDKICRYLKGNSSKSEEVNCLVNFTIKQISPQFGIR
ncbi:MAG: hypothetical protein D6681_14570 [Calditrichaeota bacterium]|nr:MAG: hypothetical protein D6681_14570 [Calditrichota bacterium]